MSGGVAHLAAAIEEDLKKRSSNLHKAYISGIADLSASALTSHKWMEPRVSKEKSKEYYISRFLSNQNIEKAKIMNCFVPEVLNMAGANKTTVILMMDQQMILSV